MEESDVFKRKDDDDDDDDDIGWPKKVLMYISGHINKWLIILYATLYMNIFCKMDRQLSDGDWSKVSPKVDCLPWGKRLGQTFNFSLMWKADDVFKINGDYDDDVSNVA